MNTLRNSLIMSRRPCPICGADMEYKPTMLAWLTRLYRRVCVKCHYVDPEKVKI